MNADVNKFEMFARAHHVGHLSDMNVPPNAAASRRPRDAMIAGGPHGGQSEQTPREIREQLIRHAHARGHRLERPPPPIGCLRREVKGLGVRAPFIGQ